MNDNTMFPGLALIIAAGIQLSCQLFKFVVYSIRDGRIEPRYLTTAGGIPSAHSAFVVSVTTGVGWLYGMASAAFSVSAVFSLIVIYDAYRLRGEVQKHAQVLNRLRATLELKDEAVLNEMVGHSLAEILWGIVYGLSVTSVVLLTLGF